MGDASADKIARNNSAFRDANDEVVGAAADFGLAPGQLTPFICECSDPRCVQIVRLTLEEYGRVRSEPRRFVHAVGHETEVEGAVRPVEQHDRYTIVEKVGVAGSLASELASDQIES